METFFKTIKSKLTIYPDDNSFLKNKILIIF